MTINVIIAIVFATALIFTLIGFPVIVFANGGMSFSPTQIPYHAVSSNNTNNTASAANTVNSSAEMLGQLTP